MPRDGPRSGVNVSDANAARMYDYYLGGTHNFAVDRENAERAIAAQPALRDMAQANRAFLGRVVRWSLAQGIDQFLDLGSGVPTVGNVHEVAHRRDPAARVAYVDFEPVAVAHASDIIEQLGNGEVTVTRADAREPTDVLSAPGVAGLLDFDRPITLLAVSMLQFITGDVADLLARYASALAPGSAVAISHISDDQPDPGVAQRMRDLCAAYDTSATPAVLRQRPELYSALERFALVEPGLVDIADWPEPDDSAPRSFLYGAVGLVS